jgi:hypothetical protein
LVAGALSAYDEGRHGGERLPAAAVKEFLTYVATGLADG